MKNLYKMLNIFALAAVIALLGGCFSPWEGDGATITINVGGGGRWTAFHLLDDDAKARISYMLDLSGPSNMTDVPFAPGTQTINLSVTPGSYTITVTAYLDGEVYAAGSTTAEARAGQSTPVNILMSYAGETIEKTFTVTFDSNGGSPVDQQIVPNGGMAAPPAKPTKSGEGFVRWCSDVTLDTEYDFDTPVTSDITLYAQWSENTYTVTFESNGGSAVDTDTVGEGGTAMPPANPVKTGFVFDGWYSDSSLTTLYNFDNQIYNDIAIYAKWLQQFTITFETNGGSSVPPRTITQSGTVTRPDNPTLDGNGFVRWCSDETLNTEYDFNTPVTSDITLYAQWSENTYTITFDSNGGSDIDEIIVGEGGTVTRPEDPILNGFVLGGWYLSTDTNFTPYDFEIPITNNITLCAKWNAAIFNNITDLGAYLFKWSANDADNPYLVSLNVDDISTLRATLNDNEGKYVNLDLSGSTTMTTIPANTFYGNADPRGCATLTGITIPDGVQTIGNSAFRSCANLASVTIGSGVTSIGTYAFYNCTNLTEITIPNSVTSIGNCAFNARNLTVINVSDSNTAYTAEGGVLYNKAKTTLVAYPSATDSFTIPDGVKSIGIGAFEGCSSLTSITIGNGVTTIGQEVFYGCSGLTSVIIGSGVTTIRDFAFSYCSGLTSITIPNNVTRIMQYAFEACSGLTSITIGSGVTNIEEYVFARCSGLTSITIPASVTQIMRGAFDRCTSLTSVTFETGSNINDVNFGATSGATFPGVDSGSGSLKYAYSTGKAGTYKRQANGTTWTKQ